MKPSVPVLLSFNAGFVDTAGFLALQGLFTAHVTGNFVTLGASYVLGIHGAAAKLLALPVFCLAIVVARLGSSWLEAKSLSVIHSMLTAKLALLSLGAALAVAFGPFKSANSSIAVLTGMVLVAAMAIQNLISRAHLSTEPPTTLMTGTTTQVMIEIADAWRGAKPEKNSAAHERLKKMSKSVGAFALGCGLAAVAFAYLQMWCFVLPPAVAFAALVAIARRAT